MRDDSKDKSKAREDLLIATALTLGAEITREPIANRWWVSDAPGGVKWGPYADSWYAAEACLLRHGLRLDANWVLAPLPPRLLPRRLR